MGKSAAWERVAIFFAKCLCADWFICKMFTCAQGFLSVIQFLGWDSFKQCSWESSYVDETFLFFICYFSIHYTVITHNRFSMAGISVDLPLFCSGALF